MRSFALCLLLLASALPLLPAAEAHTVYCDPRDAVCMADCLGTHAGYAPPHYCAVENPGATPRVCRPPSAGATVTAWGDTYGGCVSQPVRLEPCWTGPGYYVYVGDFLVVDGCLDGLVRVEPCYPYGGYYVYVGDFLVINGCFAAWEVLA